MNPAAPPGLGFVWFVPLIIAAASAASVVIQNHNRGSDADRAQAHDHALVLDLDAAEREAQAALFKIGSEPNWPAILATAGVGASLLYALVASKGAKRR